MKKLYSVVIGVLVLVVLSGCKKGPDRVTPMHGIAGKGLGGYAPGFGDYVNPQASAQPQSDYDELWVISRGSKAVSPQAGEATSGTLVFHDHGNPIPLPLKHTDVRATIQAYIASVDVVQRFENPYHYKIEAVYVFPLPHDAAVSSFIMTIGQRKIRGIIRERAEAEQIYQDARRQGYVASLLTEERPNIFTQSVANIEPAKQIDVQITYFHTLDYVDGWHEFVFPMVVGPRFNPAHRSDGVGAVGLNQRGASGQKTEVQYLAPSEISAHDISLSVDLHAGVPVEEIVSSNHTIHREDISPGRTKITLDQGDSVPNKDFVLRFRVGGDELKSTLLLSQGDGQEDGFFSLLLYPPQALHNLHRHPLELIFVLDCSGSMSGRPLEQAKDAIRWGLHHLQPQDSFQLINFSSRASQMGPAPLLATDANVQKGLRYLDGLASEGGTMMIEGIRAALNFPHDPKRLRFVCFITDGFIGNDVEILTELQRNLRATRVFSFGIGPSCNRYLLDSMAKVGRGAVAYLGLNDNAADIMADFFERISHPALANITVDWGNLQVHESFPSSIPDLFVGRASVLTGRYRRSGEAVVTVKGFSGGEPIAFSVPIVPVEKTFTALPKIWARTKIAEASLDFRGNTAPETLKQVALDYGLVSAWTSFVAVDASRITPGQPGHAVPVPVPVPEGVDYEKTVTEK